MKRKLFGTDGIRGEANIYPMTGDMAFLLGRAVVHHFSLEHKDHDTKIVIGKDTRRSCYMLEEAFVSGVCSQGGRAIVTGPLPTPGVAFATYSMRARAGIMISASHNIFSDNGIKIFDSKGYKLSDDIELELESLVFNPKLMPIKKGKELGRVERLKEIYGRYIVHVKRAFSENVDMTGIRIILDAANGASYKVAPIIFEELGADVISFGVNPNGININNECGSQFPESVQKNVVKYRGDIGLCMDGDGDRLVVVDENGELVHGDKLIALYCKFLMDKGALKKGDTVVGTIMSNLGLEQYCKKLGLNFYRSNVGDRYMIKDMIRNSSFLGGENSGHIIFSEYSTTGDACIAALKVVECVKYYKKSISQLVSDIPMYNQFNKSIAVSRKTPFEDIAPIKKIIDEAHKTVGTKGRVIIRYSGTEPVIRFMIEGANKEVASNICLKLENAIISHLL